MTQSIENLETQLRGKIIAKSNTLTPLIQKSTFLITFLFFSFQVQSFNLDEFLQEIDDAGKIYTDFEKGEGKALFTEGKLTKANEKLVNLVNEKGFYDYFILGNKLFITDPDASYRFMKNAEEIEADNPYVLFERGIHEHRRNNFEKAGEYYQKFLNTDIGKDHPMALAYITHTNLMTNKIEASYKSWKTANFSSNHTGIEKAMYAIFSKKNQEKKREQLITDIKNGQAFKLCDLWDLDSKWESDWWNSDPRKMYLDYDKVLINQIVKDYPDEKQFIDFCINNDDFSKEKIMSKLTDLGVNEDKKSLPKSSVLIYKILTSVMKNELINSVDFLTLFENHINKLSAKYPDDTIYLDILAFLYSDTKNKEKLQEINLLGWKKHMISNYAASYVVELENTDELKMNLEEALKDFPNYVVLNNVYMSMFGENDKQAITRFVASQFANVKNNWAGRYRLSDYMASLKHEIDKLEKTDQTD